MPRGGAAGEVDVPAPAINAPGAVDVPAPGVNAPDAVDVPAPRFNAPGDVDVPAPRVNAPDTVDAPAAAPKAAPVAFPKIDVQISIAPTIQTMERVDPAELTRDIGEQMRRELRETFRGVFADTGMRFA